MITLFARKSGSKHRNWRRPLALSGRGQLRAAIEMLERRQLMTVTVTDALANIAGDPGGTSGSINLAEHFEDPAVSIVRLNTPAGNIDIATFDQDAPLNAAQFVSLASTGKYNGSVFQRYVAGFVLQGGSQHADGTAITGVATVPSEPNTNGHSNTRGTVAFARVPAFTDFNSNGVQDAGEPDNPGGGPNTASSGFFFNLDDNSGRDTSPSNLNGLDFQNGGFTVLGEVVGGTDANGTPVANGMTIVNNLAQLGDSQRLINTATVRPDVTFSVSSSNSALVNPVLNGSNLTLNYGPGQGSADITVTGTDINGQSVQRVFTAGVGEIVVSLGAVAGAKSATFTDPDGTQVTISLAGNGNANLAFIGAGLTQNLSKGKIVVAGSTPLLDSITIAGSAKNTALTITSKGGDGTVVVHSITADGAIKSINAKTTALSGTLTTGGTLASLVLGSADVSTIVVGNSGGSTSITLGSATDTNINSAVAVKAIKVSSFASSDTTADTLTAPSIGSVTTSGGFGQTLNVAGAIGSIKSGSDLTGNITAASIGTLTVNGNLAGAAITLSQPAGKAKAIGTMKVGGSVTGTTIRSTASIGSITAGALTATNIFVGVTGNALPTLATDFAAQSAISTIKLKNNYENSNVAAFTLGKLTLGSLVIDNGGTTFGLAAGTIATLAGSIGTGVKFSLKKLDTPADFTAQATGLNLQDARVVLV